MYTTGNCAKNAMKLLSHNGFTQISALAMVFIVADAFAAGSGTEADPWTGSNVTAIMDAGTDTAPAYYLVDGTYWDPSMDMFVGIYGPNNMLSIRNGGSVHSSYERRIGMMSGSSGTVTVSGLGSEWCTSIYSSLFPSLIVGSEGAGTLNIENGGLVTSEWSVVAFITGSSGTVKVTGSGSVWRDSNWLCVGWGDYWGVGDTCTGLLSIENGGSVASLNSDIGYGVGGRGVVTVSGEGSMWLDSNWICVGSSGEGTLSINNKGQAWCIDSAIGYGFDDMYGSSTYGLPTTTGRGSVTVDGADSIWNISRWLCVGGSGTGSLDIEDGGSVENYDCAIGYLDGSEGSVTVAGSGSTWNNSKWLCVGQSGSGSLSIDNGGRVTSVDSAIGWLPGSTGSVTVAGSGSIWSDEKWICVCDFGTGSMSIQDGGSVTNDESDIGFGADGTGSAIVTGSGSIWNIKRLLSVGGSGTGALCIDNGGCVNSVESDIGVFEGGIGSATVTGSGSTWTNTQG
jgi:T5SS/PEP-CTERM-associated repeat protein